MTTDDASHSDASDTVCVPGATDLPDPGNADTNCDGIDGDRSAAVFVATDGDDSNPGTAEAPVRSLRVGLASARTGHKTQVLVAVGMYTETSTLTLVDGVGVFGGFDRANGWRRGSGMTVVSGPAVAAEARMITSPTTIARIEFDAADGQAPGGASIALRAVDASMLRIEDHAVLSAGRGAAGSNGAVGDVGASGSRGGSGGAGAPDDQSMPGSAGSAATNSSCPMANGGRGGIGGSDPNFRGTDGASSAAGLAGGAGGAMPGCSGVSGRDGATAVADGDRGTAGRGGMTAGRFDATSFAYVPSNGTDGVDGNAGAGGGGGGGSSGQTTAACLDGSGNGGGGGGSGGCGGSGGTGGGGGGASVALLAVRSAVTVSNVTLQTLGGGVGGSGGTGGMGGTGGGGGLGGTASVNEIGKGGDGGGGKRGGEGGAGGGGGGGPSVGIWADGMATHADNVIYQLGEPGRGGTSPGGTPAEGARGAQQQMQGP